MQEISTFKTIQTMKSNSSLEITPQKKLHVQLAQFNQHRLTPQFIEANWAIKTLQDAHMLVKEGNFVEKERQHVQQYLVHMPQNAEAFVQWFNQLKSEAPGQGDALFPWLANEATMEQMRWFLQQEAAGEAGFDDLCVLFLKCFQVFAANLMSLRHQNVVELLGVTFRPPR